MESASKVELERYLTKYERHLTGLFTLVVLQPDFQRAQSVETREYIKKNAKRIAALTCWVADPGIEDIANSVDFILFVLELASITSTHNRNVILTCKEGRITPTYNG